MSTEIHDTATLVAECDVIRRDGQRTPFNASKIQVALTKAFLSIEGDHASNSKRIHQIVEALVDHVVTNLLRRLPTGGSVHIEDIQDQVELTLMRGGHHKVARSYVLYREERTRQRMLEEALAKASNDEGSTIRIRSEDGDLSSLSESALKELLTSLCSDLTAIDVDALLKNTWRNLFDGMPAKDVDQALILSARSMIETEPEYSFVTARLLDHALHHEVTSTLGLPPAAQDQDLLAPYIERAIQDELLDARLGELDLARLAQSLKSERSRQFTYLGLQTLHDRYFIRTRKNKRLETPQLFFMRVAMGLALDETGDREAHAIEYYELLSSFDFMSSTPTLFNSGTLRPQLSSCYLTTVPDDLDGIFGAIRDNALLSKYAGGLGNDWTPVRGLGSHIKGTQGSSQGVVPFLKVANDTAVAVNQGGKRKGAVCAYLETWHIDIEEFLDLRKNTGDDRRRTHDMNTANWIPDLFMERVMDDAEWTLFSPDEAPDLHELYGLAFREAYENYEAKADRGELHLFKRVKAVTLWRKMLGMLFETGHPWLTFKDPCNIRYTNQHKGVVHSSNLCTEITLHTNQEEIAVCNLGSVNLAQHITEAGVDHQRLRKTIRTAMRMLDNVIDYNFYATPQAKHSNAQHRPVGLGMMGFQDALYTLKMPYSSQEAVEFADRSMEAISYYALEASSDLAVERGTYSTYEGSLWSQGILPYDSLRKLNAARPGRPLQLDNSITLDWDTLRDKIQTQGMRNSNCLAIAPTATIANICGVTASIEPTYQNLYVKSNLSGEFTVVNPHLVNALKAEDLWDEVMVNDLKYFDGSVAEIDRIPESIKALFSTSFEIDPSWLIEAAARRQKWIDQAQSLNLYVAEASGPKLDRLYKLAWLRGLKTTYYLRTLGATANEKVADRSEETPASQPKMCSIDDPDCEACQ